MHLIVFDVDGTLVESDEFDGVLYARAVRDVLDIEVDEEWSTYRHVTDSGILDEILDRHTVEIDRSVAHASVKKAFVALVRDYLNDRNGRLPEIPGARAFVNRLIAHPKVCVAVATGGWRETAAMKLRAIGLDPETLTLSSGSDAISRVEIMQIAAQRALAGRPADRETYFGDGPWDRDASRQMDWDFIGIGPDVEHGSGFDDFLDQGAIAEVLRVTSLLRSVLRLRVLDWHLGGTPFRETGGAAQPRTMACGASGRTLRLNDTLGGFSRSADRLVLRLAVTTGPDDVRVAEALRA